MRLSLQFEMSNTDCNLRATVIYSIAFRFFSMHCCFFSHLMSYSYDDFEHEAGEWSSVPENWADDSQALTEGPTEDAIKGLAEDSATRAIMSQMYLIRLAEPAVRVGLRALPDSKEKKLAIEVFNKWAELEKENSRVSPPNLLHFAYMSLIMARGLVLILNKIVQGGLGAGATMAINIVATRLKAAVA